MSRVFSSLSLLQVPLPSMHAFMFFLSRKSFLSRSFVTMIPIILAIFFVLITSSSSFEDDVECLRGIKSSFVNDTGGHLLSWNFTETSYGGGSVCNFSGVSCRNLQENHVISLNLSSYSLSGPIPSALRLCSSVTYLDLSNNFISGPIPASLCAWLPRLTHLNLSSNSLTGPIPHELANCSFLKSLDISFNRLSGSLPSSISLLLGLQTIHLSGNGLSGPPLYDASGFQKQRSLYGYPNSSASRKHLHIVVNLAAGVFGFLLSFAISYAVWRFSHSAAAGRKEEGSRQPLSNKPSSSLRNGPVPVILFGSPIGKMKLADLRAATGNFHPGNIIVATSVSIGTSYKASLPDGSTLTVKRLHDYSVLSNNQFQAEMGRIGQVCHPNLVPLLGYCILKKERLLIYKNMANQSLSSRLQLGDVNLDWPTRLRIAIGGAQGLAWLHHGFPIPFLHQNLTSSAVLLDEEYEPGIADFGLASILRPSAKDQEPSTKMDVYEFGVILLELATGDVAGEEGFKENFVYRVMQLCVTGRILEAIDESLRAKGHDDQIVEFLNIGCFCVLSRPRERPSMREVYRSLRRIGRQCEFSEGSDEFSHVFSERSDEFSRMFGNNKPETAELMKLAYCIYTGTNPYI